MMMKFTLPDYQYPKVVSYLWKVTGIYQNDEQSTKKIHEYYINLPSGTVRTRNRRWKSKKDTKQWISFLVLVGGIGIFRVIFTPLFSGALIINPLMLVNDVRYGKI